MHPASMHNKHGNLLMGNLLEMANSVGVDTFIEKPLDSLKLENSLTN